MKRAFFFLALVAMLLVACTLGLSRVPASLTPIPEVTTLPLGTPIPLSEPLVDQPQLVDFHMLNELDGWGMTESAVLRTNDGGLSWHNVTPPDMTPVGYGAAGSFPQVGEGLILAPDASDPMHSGTLYRTADGGNTWMAIPVPFGTGQLRFFNLDEGFAMASLGVAAGSNAVALYQTRDGGKTWDPTFINDPTVQGSGDEIPLGGLKGVFFPLDMQTAWVGGVIYAPGTVYLYRTDDSGRHWRPVDLEPPPDSEEAQLSIESIQFITGLDGFLAMQVTQNVILRVLYATHDGGATWSLLPTVFANGRAADFVSRTDGFVYDGDQFHVTHDEGRTWTNVEPDVVFSDSFMKMDFVSTQTGWVTSMDPTTSRIRLYKTTDGGATWLPQ